MARRKPPVADYLLTPSEFCRDVVPMSPSKFRAYCSRFRTLIEGLVPFSTTGEGEPGYRIRMSAVVRHFEEDLAKGHWQERDPTPFPFDARRRGGKLRRGRHLEEVPSP